MYFLIKMILFCEDCGEKNELKKSNIQNGKAVFRCDFCNYLNSYAIPVSIKKDVEIRDILFEKFKYFPEIIDAFLYLEKTGIIENKMQGMLQDADLNILGQHLTSGFLMAQSFDSSIHQMMAVISDKHITIQMIEPHVFILIAGKIPSLPMRIQDLLSDLS